MRLRRYALQRSDKDEEDAKCSVGPAVAHRLAAGIAGMTGSADGTGAAARFNGPTGVAVNSTGSVYVVDQSNATIRKVTPTGTTTTVAGTAGMVGILLGTTPRLASPRGLAIVPPRRGAAGGGLSVMPMPFCYSVAAHSIVNSMESSISVSALSSLRRPILP